MMFIHLFSVLRFLICFRIVVKVLIYVIPNVINTTSTHIRWDFTRTTIYYYYYYLSTHPQLCPSKFENPPFSVKYLSYWKLNVNLNYSKQDGELFSSEEEMCSLSKATLRTILRGLVAALTRVFPECAFFDGSCSHRGERKEEPIKIFRQIISCPSMAAPYYPTTCCPPHSQIPPPPHMPTIMRTEIWTIFSKVLYILYISLSFVK